MDQSGPALEDARENFRINGLDPDRHAFEEADVFSWVAPNRADLVISDPPSLARRQAGESAAKKAEKRAAKVDELLVRSRYADYWAFRLRSWITELREVKG